MAKSIIPSYLLTYRYPDNEYSGTITDKNFLLSSQSRVFISKINKGAPIANVQIPGAEMNNLFAVGDENNAKLTTL